MQLWKLLFRPAISLLNKLGYTQKFSLIWLVSLGALIVLSLSLYTSLNRVIEPSLRQLEGLALLKPVGQFVQLLQKHRGLSITYFDNPDAAHLQRNQNEADLFTAFAVLEKKLPTHLAHREEFQQIRSSWLLLMRQQASLGVAERFAVHTDLIKRISIFQLDIADDYGLIQDAEISSYYLIDTLVNRLPETIEMLGQLRAYGTRVLIHKQETPMVKMNVLVAQANYALDNFSKGLTKVAINSPELRSKLFLSIQDITVSANQILRLAEEDIISNRFSTPPEMYFSASTTAIDQCYTQMHENLLPIAESLIQRRVDQARHYLRISISIALALFAFLVYSSISMYYAIIDNIKKLASAASGFAAGDLNIRLQLETQDELKQVANSFNEMADGFNHMLEARRIDHARLRATVETAMDAVIQIDSKGKIIDWNHQAENIFGWKREQTLGQYVHELIVPQRYREAHIAGINRFLNTGQMVLAHSRVELSAIHLDGHEFPIELSVTPIAMPDGYEFSAFIRDITNKKQSDQLIWQQANIDTLTGLPNRHMFYDRLAQDIKKANRNSEEIALLFIDLDKFKEVNDTLGHGVGDVLLIDAAKRITQCVRESDTVARLGGDEFVVILTDMDEIRGIERVTKNILHKLTSVFQLGNDMVYISASIGITIYPNDATEIDDLIKNADQAMYTSKDRGRNCFSYFTHSMQQAAQIRQRLITDLRSALIENQFFLHFQPVVDMVTGRIHKAEVLLRWQHPEFGLINPDRFIPLTEETGMITAIGDWVFRQAAQQLKQWRTSYDAKFQLSINMSPVQFRDSSNLSSTWGDYLRELQLPGDSMIIEITEGLLLEVEPVVTERLEYLRTTNLQLAIDDFGTGYSSLSYLKKFDIDYLKIDRSFVRNLSHDDNDMALAEAIIVMAHKLGLKVIAEGVETQVQLNLLDAAGCDYAQGYFFSMPVKAEEFEAFF